MATVQKADRKLTFIPVMFIFLRIWGTIQFFYSIGVSHHLCMVPPEYHHHTPVCAPEDIFIGFVVLGYFQVCVRQKWKYTKFYIHNSNCSSRGVVCVCACECVHVCMLVELSNLISPLKITLYHLLGKCFTTNQRCSEHVERVSHPTTKFSILH